MSASNAGPVSGLCHGEAGLLAGDGGGGDAQQWPSPQHGSAWLQQGRGLSSVQADQLSSSHPCLKL